MPNFAISIPQLVRDGQFDPTSFRAFMARAEALGFDSAWTMEQVPIVRQALAEAGRDPSSFRIAKRIYIAVDDDMDRARQRVTDGLHQLYSYFGMRDMTAVAVYGPPDACVEGIRAVVDAGAELILLNPLSDEREQMERLAAEVVPKFALTAPSSFGKLRTNG